MNSPSCLATCRLIARRPPALAAISTATSHVRPVPATPPDFTTKPLQPCRLPTCLAFPAPLHLQKYPSCRLSLTTVARYASVASSTSSNHIPTSSPSAAQPYHSLTIGVPKETYPGERRVAITPANVKLLLKKGFTRILVERGAGLEAQFTDEAYEQAGAETVDQGTIFSDSDIVLKVRAPTTHGADSEVDALREGVTIVSFLYPSQNKHVVDRLASRKATSFAMDMIPRISRAQIFDALRYVAIIRHPVPLLQLLMLGKLHGEYRRLQGCSGGIKPFWTFPDRAGHSRWQGVQPFCYRTSAADLFRYRLARCLSLERASPV